MSNEIKIDGLKVGRSSINEEFPSNSNKVKNKEQEDLLERKVQKVVSGKVVERKKSLGKKFAEVFIGEDNNVHSISEYVVKDILIPSAKSTIIDLVSMIGETVRASIEISLFGTTLSGKRNRGRGSSGKSYVSYDGYSRTSDRDKRDRDRDRDDRDRKADKTITRHNLGDIVLETRGDAEEVLNTMVDLIQDYGVVSIADFYGLIDIPGNFTDNNYGWDDLSGVKPIRVTGGYILNFPKTRVIN